jgi:hypothetical protein
LKRQTPYSSCPGSSKWTKSGRNTTRNLILQD